MIHGIPLQSLSNTTGTTLFSAKLLSPDEVRCFKRNPSQQPPTPTIDYQDCNFVLNEVLLSPHVSVSQIWSSIDRFYPRIHGTCRIALDHNPALHNPQDRFREYQVAISAAIVLHICQPFQRGGFAYVTRNEQFIADVRTPGTVGDGNVTNLLSEPENIMNNTSIASDLALPLPSDLAALDVSRSANLSATAPTCTSQQPHLVHPASIVAEDCYALVFRMLTIPDISTYKAWSGLDEPRRWIDTNHQRCVISLRSKSAESRASFKLIYVILAAVQIVQACVVGQDLPWGGTTDVGRGQFFVEVAGTAQGNAVLAS